MAKHPLMPAQFFSDNRKNLLEKLSNDSMALLQAAEPMIRNSDQPHFWRQDSNFFYFTGIEQAGCSLLLNPNADGKPTEILFIPPVDPELEKWEGELLTSKKATAISGIKSVFTIDNFATVFFRAQKWKDLLYCEVNDIFPDQPLTKQHLFLKDLAVRLPGLQLKKLASLTSGLRVHKKPEEVDNIRKALSIANQGIRSVIQKIHPDMYEYEIEAELAYHYIANGCTRLGFDSIVAAGKNATTLHYT
ncbi:MAG: Xaa-Pro aminopeptidase, partial [bacterium]